MSRGTVPRVHARSSVSAVLVARRGPAAGASARRHRAGTTATEPVVEVGPIRLDESRHEVQVGGAVVHLTPIEYRLLALFMRHPGKVLTHRHLLREIWGPNAVEHVHYLRVRMQALRAKVEADPARPSWLLTELGVGYRLRDA